MSSFGLPLIALFLSTPSARRATAVCDLRVVHLAISIHALREEGDLVELAHQGARRLISIHALREEGDEPCRALRPPQKHFYPRPPRGGRPCGNLGIGRGCKISIHALREEGDCRGFRTSAEQRAFLSTPSARRATRRLYGKTQAQQNFYPRPPRGGRRHPCRQSSCWQYFYPRPPRGGRRKILGKKSPQTPFLSTPSARRATRADNDHD